MTFRYPQCTLIHRVTGQVARTSSRPKLCHWTLELHRPQFIFMSPVSKNIHIHTLYTKRGGEWYLEKRGSRKILAGSRNLGSVFDKSRSLVFSWFVFTFFESRNVSPKSLGLGFLIRISASRRVSDFTICHPYKEVAKAERSRVRIVCRSLKP